MPLIGANELKKKILIEIEGQPYQVLDVFFATPTAAGIATPSAAPATTFAGVDIPSSSPPFSSSFESGSSATDITSTVSLGLGAGFATANPALRHPLSFALLNA